MFNSPLLQSYQLLWPPPGRPICGFVMGLWLFGPEGFDRKPTRAGCGGWKKFRLDPEIRDPEGVRMNGDDTVDGSEIRDSLTI